MSVTLGFVLRVDHAPAVIVPPVQDGVRSVIDVRPVSADVRPLRSSTSCQWQQRPAGSFVNTPLTYDNRGQNSGTMGSTGFYIDLFV